MIWCLKSNALLTLSSRAKEPPINKNFTHRIYMKVEVMMRVINCFEKSFQLPQCSAMNAQNINNSNWWTIFMSEPNRMCWTSKWSVNWTKSCDIIMIEFSTLKWACNFCKLIFALCGFRSLDCRYCIFVFYFTFWSFYDYFIFCVWSCNLGKNKK